MQHDHILNAADLSIPQPCPEAWEEMQTCADGNRFCAHCQKKVFDLGGKTRADLEAIITEHGRDICVNLYADQLDEPSADRDFRPTAEPPSRPAFPPWLRKASGIAATLALLSTAEASGLPDSNPGPAIVHSTEAHAQKNSKPRPNTLLTGVVMHGSANIVDDIRIKVRLNDKTIRTINTKRGFFSVDLKAFAIATDQVEIVIPKQVFRDKSGIRIKGRKVSRTYARTQYVAQLGESQNLALQISVERKPHLLEARLGGCPRF